MGSIKIITLFRPLQVLISLRKSSPTHCDQLLVCTRLPEFLSNSSWSKMWRRKRMPEEKYNYQNYARRFIKKYILASILLISLQSCTIRFVPNVFICRVYGKGSVNLTVAAEWKTTFTSLIRVDLSFSESPRLSAAISPDTSWIFCKFFGLSWRSLSNTFEQETNTSVIFKLRIKPISYLVLNEFAKSCFSIFIALRAHQAVNHFYFGAWSQQFFHQDFSNKASRSSQEDAFVFVEVSNEAPLIQ